MSENWQVYPIFMSRQETSIPDKVRHGLKRVIMSMVNHILVQQTHKVHSIWTKSGMDVLLGPSKKRVKPFLILKSKIAAAPPLWRIGYKLKSIWLTRQFFSRHMFSWVINAIHHSNYSRYYQPLPGTLSSLRAYLFNRIWSWEIKTCVKFLKLLVFVFDENAFIHR